MVIRGFRTKVEPGPKVEELKFLLDAWREKGPLIKVKSCDVVPDSSNRGHTGLSIDHVHFIASNILKFGFRSRDGDVEIRRKVQPHDIPVLCRGNSTCPIAVDSLNHWKKNVADEPLFPKIVINEKEGWFTSLGNGHFTQALNLFRHNAISKFTGKPFVPPDNDVKLLAALNEGVEAIVLRQDTPIETRREIATLLNDTHDYKWTVTNGNVDISPANCYLERFTQFEAQTKVADSEALSALVQLELGIFEDPDNMKPSEEKLAETLKSKL